MNIYYTAGSILVGFFVFWFLTAAFLTSSIPPPVQLRNKSILLLIGHPDDEAMFFAPSLQALNSFENGNRVRILCLSTGNAVGQGEIRRGELLKSARRLGVRREQDVHIIDDPRFQDGPGTDWKKEDIAEFLAQHFVEYDDHDPATKPASSSNTKTSAPDVILTFDKLGVSLHPNHCACYHGAVHYLRHHNNNQKPPTLYTLTSLPTARKYIHVFDALVTLVAITTSKSNPELKSTSTSNSAPRADTHGSSTTTTTTTNNSKSAHHALFISDFTAYARAFNAMVYAHRTQMLWFRWGWIILGRYMVVNDVRREHVQPEPVPETS